MQLYLVKVGIKHMNMVKKIIHRILNLAGYDVFRLSPSGRQGDPKNIPDRDYYRPLFSPWYGYGAFSSYYALARSRTLSSVDRCWILYSLVMQSLPLGGEVWECGVYKGGTAAMIARLLADHKAHKLLRLFDTFTGMPDSDLTVDLHHKGDFADTSIESVREYIGNASSVAYHQGYIPETFRDLEGSTICFAHVDVDIYKSVMDCCIFIFPRLCVGGVMVFDDYGFPSCPGARSAVDSFFADSGFIPLILSTGQAVVFKNREPQQSSPLV